MNRMFGTMLLNDSCGNCTFARMESFPQKDVCTDSVFKELFFAHARHLHNFLFYKGAPTAEAEDLVQEAIL
ncbi:MAG: hypothetical protein EPO28_02045 [Saprospiraceae bacterium]|nr:MAG: hypothetical protein EPO28_02045 [Saprospiraceae bacterium]